MKAFDFGNFVLFSSQKVKFCFTHCPILHYGFLLEILAVESLSTNVENGNFCN